MYWREWSTTEVETLCRWYGKWSINYLVKMLPKRTIGSIKKKASSLGLRVTPELQEWKKMLEANPGLTMRQYAIKMGTSEKTARKYINIIRRDEKQKADQGRAE